MKVALIWSNFMSYHVARLRALQEKSADDVLGIELTGAGDSAGLALWQSRERQGLRIETLFPETDLRTLPPGRIAESLIRKMTENGIQAVFVNGYGTPEMRRVIRWAGRSGVACYIFSETKKNDFRRFFWKEWFKRWILRGVDGAICGGRLHREYLEDLGMPAERIFTGYDVVDNAFFAVRSDEARGRAAEMRLAHALPARYFLSVCRFVEKKNLERLISAYQHYRQSCSGGDPWALVLCGAGPLETRLKDRVREEGIPGVVFAGSRTSEELAVYYGLSECFVLASTTEQWGLVVNEAMASGVPVLVSRAAGAADELIEEGVNGFTFDPFNIGQIAAHFCKIHAMSGVERAALGRRGRGKVAEYSPGHFADGVLSALRIQPRNQERR